MIKFRLYRNNNEKSATAGSWYAKAVPDDIMTFDEFISHVAAHHSVFGEATIKGCFAEIESCLREVLLDGKGVRLGELGIFRLGISTKPATTAEEFTVSGNIKSVHMNLYLGPRFRAKQLYADAEFSELREYTSPTTTATE